MVIHILAVIIIVLALVILKLALMVRSIPRNLGQLIKVNNKHAHHAAADWYYHVWIRDESGAPESLMMTEVEYLEIRNRARNNPEDVPELE